MKSIAIIECKTCGGEYFAGSQSLTIDPNEMVEFVTKRVAKCHICKQKVDRTMGGPKKRLQQ